MFSKLDPDDRRFLLTAAELAEKGWGRVHPNPVVGCVLVRDGKVVGTGWHQELGGAHAEVSALENAGGKAQGATAYVSLEPCNHFGRTPPCSRALLDAGVKRVVYGADDPGRVSAGGGAALREGGIEVVGPAFTRDEGRRLNPAFFFNQEREATFVALKLAQSLDGKITAAPGERTHLTGRESKEETHRLRAGFDGVMVGVETVLVDDPLLTVREGVPFRKQPTRVVLDTGARTPPDARLFQDVLEAPVMVFTGQDAPEERVSNLQGAGAVVHRVPRIADGVSVEAALGVCWDSGILSLFCEGGGRLGSHLMRTGFARRLYLFVAPFVLGQEAVPAFRGLEDRAHWESWEPASPARSFGRDTLLVLDRKD